MFLSDLCFLLDLNSSIECVRLYDYSESFITESYHLGHYAESLAMNPKYGSCLVQHWEIFGDDEFGFIVSVSIDY